MIKFKEAQKLAMEARYKSNPSPLALADDLAVTSILDMGLSKGELTPEKAKKILHDKEVKGHPLTDKQRKFMGVVASGKARKAVSPESPEEEEKQEIEREKKKDNTLLPTPAPKKDKNVLSKPDVFSAKSCKKSGIEQLMEFAKGKQGDLFGPKKKPVIEYGKRGGKIVGRDKKGKPIYAGSAQAKKLQAEQEAKKKKDWQEGKTKKEPKEIKLQDKHIKALEFAKRFKVVTPGGTGGTSSTVYDLVDGGYLEAHRLDQYKLTPKGEQVLIAGGSSKPASKADYDKAAVQASKYADEWTRAVDAGKSPKELSVLAGKAKLWNQGAAEAAESMGDKAKAKGHREYEAFYRKHEKKHEADADRANRAYIGVMQDGSDISKDGDEWAKKNTEEGHGEAWRNYQAAADKFYHASRVAPSDQQKRVAIDHAKKFEGLRNKHEKLEAEAHDRAKEDAKQMEMGAGRTGMDKSTKKSLSQWLDDNLEKALPKEGNKSGPTSSIEKSEFGMGIVASTLPEWLNVNRALKKGRKGETPIGGTTPGGYKRVAKDKYVKVEGGGKVGEQVRGADDREIPPTINVKGEKVSFMFALAYHPNLWVGRVQNVEVIGLVKDLKLTGSGNQYEYSGPIKVIHKVLKDPKLGYTAPDGISLPRSENKFLSDADFKYLMSIADAMGAPKASIGFSHNEAKPYIAHRLKSAKTYGLARKEFFELLMDDKIDQASALMRRSKVATQAHNDILHDVLSKKKLDGPNKTKKSMEDTMDSIEQLANFGQEGDMEKAQDMPKGEPKQGLGQGPEQGGDLAGVGETSGTNDAGGGQATGKPDKEEKLSEDDEKDEDQMKEHKKPIETVKSMRIPSNQRDMVAKENAQAISKLKKGEEDTSVEPTKGSEPEAKPELEKGRVGQQGFVRYSEQSDIETEALLKSNEFYTGGSPSVIPFSRPISNRITCPKCETSMSKSLSACPSCGYGTVVHRVLPSGEAQGDHDGEPIVKSRAGKLQPNIEKDVVIK